MTTATTVAGLWPLALVTGRENEIWPPFATVVMGGLVTSTLLTLLVIPVGFVFLNRLDRLFGRLGPWVVIGWVGGHRGGHDAADRRRRDHLADLADRHHRAGRRRCCSGVAVLLFRKPDVPRAGTRRRRAAGGRGALPAQDLRAARARSAGPGGPASASPSGCWRRGGRAFDPRSARGRILPLAAGARRRALPGPLAADRLLAPDLRARRRRSWPRRAAEAGPPGAWQGGRDGPGRSRRRRGRGGVHGALGRARLRRVEVLRAAAGRPTSRCRLAACGC